MTRDKGRSGNGLPDRPLFNDSYGTISIWAIMPIAEW